MSTHTNGGFLDVVLDGPPGPDGGRFVEVEDANGRSVDVGGYIGESTRREVEYAERAGKPVDYLEPLP